MTDAREEEFSAYVQRREDSLHRTAYLLTGDVHQAEDLVQNALLQLYRAWDRVADSSSRDGYVRRILVNENNSSWRKAWRKREVSSGFEVRERSRDTTGDIDTHNAVWGLVKTLPPKQRAVIVLRYFEDLAVETIAEVMGISAGTVKSQANRALATLRAHPDLTDLEDWA